VAWRGNGVNTFWRSGGFTTPTAYTWFLHYRNTAAPGAGTVDLPMGFGNAASPATVRAGLCWDHNTDANFRGAVYHMASGGTFTPVKYTTPLAGNTWYRLGGRYDGSSELSAWLNGTKEAQATGVNPLLSTTVFFSILAGDGGTNGVNAWFNDDGDVAHCALWTDDLSDDEMEALGQGFSPLLFRTDALLAYVPCPVGPATNVGVDWNTTRSITTGAITNVDDPDIFYYPDNLSWSLGAAVQSGRVALINGVLVNGPLVGGGLVR
jgi:hypothetical protein